MNMDIAELWEVCLQFEYNKDLLVQGIEEWINAQSNNEKILDCACGTGFPSIHLLQKGFDITCTDASAEMLKHFKKNAIKEGIRAEPICIRWQELSKYFNACFDIVMCRGNSLIYVDGWDIDNLPDEKLISESLINFGKCLKPNGVLYIDTTSESNLNSLKPE